MNISGNHKFENFTNNGVANVMPRQFGLMDLEGNEVEVDLEDLQNLEIVDADELENLQEDQETEELENLEEVDLEDLAQFNNYSNLKGGNTQI